MQAKYEENDQNNINSEGAQSHQKEESSSELQGT
jgi:hypothetical protein